MISKQKFRKNNTKKNRKKTKGGKVEQHVKNEVKDALNVDNLGDLTLDDFKKRMDSQGYIQSTWHGLTNDFDSYKKATSDEDKDKMLDKLASHFKSAEDSYFQDIEEDDSTTGKILARGYNQTKLLYNRATKNQCTAAAKEAWIQAQLKYGNVNLNKQQLGELYYEYHPNCCNDDFDNKNQKFCSDEEKKLGRKFRTIKSVATSIPRGLYNATVADGIYTFDKNREMNSGGKSRRKSRQKGSKKTRNKKY